MENLVAYNNFKIMTDNYFLANENRNKSPNEGLTELFVDRYFPTTGFEIQTVTVNNYLRLVFMLTDLM